MQKLNGAQILIELLKQHDVTTIFGIPGGDILPVYEALYESPIRHILAGHEQGACFMAQGMARTTRKPAVCLSTSGPGATNLITAVSDAFSDSVPLVIITSQVPTDIRGTNAFQEVDISIMVKKITKQYYNVDSVENIALIINNAFCLATEGRPGPVWVDIPKDIQTAKTNFKFSVIQSINNVESSIDSEIINKVREMINASRNPVIIAGHGVMLTDTADSLQQLAENCMIPVVTTLHGITCMNSDHPLFYGMAGMHGSVVTNKILNNADLVLALGIRFDNRLTGNINEFCPNAKFIHIDINPAELNKLKKADLAIAGDLSDWLPAIEQAMDKKTNPCLPSDKTKDIFSDDQTCPSHWIKAFAASLPANIIITTDVGQHQMWVAQSFPFRKSDLWLTSGGQGTMGFGLPVAIGAAIANKDKHVVCFTGDGSLLMNIQELITLTSLHLNITIVVMNNGSLGMVRQQQQLFYHNHFQSSIFSQPNDYVAIANGFGVRAVKANAKHIEEISDLNLSEGPLLIDLQINTGEMVWPMIKPGKSIDSMMYAKQPETEKIN